MKYALLLALMVVAGCSRGSWKNDPYPLEELFHNERVYTLKSTGQICGDMYQAESFDGRTRWFAFVYSKTGDPILLSGASWDFSKKFVEDNCK